MIPTSTVNVSRLLGNHAFRNIWIAGLISVTGSQISRIAIILHVFNGAGKVSDIVFLLLLTTIPATIVAPFAGALIDRFDKRLLLITTELVRMAVLVIVITDPSLWAIYIMMLFMSAGAITFEPAKSALVAMVVPAEQLPRANGFDQSAVNLVMIAGPVIGVEIYSNFGLTMTLVIDAASFLLSAILIRAAPIQRVPSPSAAMGLVHATTRDIKAGWRYLAAHRIGLQLVLLMFVSVMCVGVWMPLAPFFIRDFLHDSDRMLGIQLSTFGLGGVAGGLLAPGLSRRLGKGALVIAAMIGEGIVMTAYSMIPDSRTSVALCFLWGVAVSAMLVPAYSILQETIYHEFLGRVFSVLKQSESIATMVALMLALGLQGFMSPRWILSSAGATYVTIVITIALTRRGRALARTT